MTTGFMLPSCNYNIVLSDEDLQKLLTTGSIRVHIHGNVPCETGRAVWDSDKKDFETFDEKTIPNNLCFKLENDVYDCEAGHWPVQFLTINLNREPKKEHPCQNCKTGWGIASSTGVESCHDTCEKLSEFNKEKSK